MNTSWDNNNLLEQENDYFYEELRNIEGCDLKTLKDLEYIYYVKLLNSILCEDLEFTFDDIENMEIWEYKYFLFDWDCPLLFKRVIKTMPSVESDYKLFNYMINRFEQSKYWKVTWIFVNDKIKQVSKKSFYRIVLDFEYLFKTNNLDILWSIITHETLALIDKLYERSSYLFLPSDIKLNELEWYTLNELEKMNYKEVKTNWFIASYYGRSHNYWEMEVWEIKYLQDDCEAFIVRRVRKTLPKYEDNDFEVLFYNLWINYPTYYVWLKKWLSWRKEMWYVTQKYFYMCVISNEYTKRINMLSKLTNKTIWDKRKINKYWDKYYKYYFRKFR